LAKLLEILWFKYEVSNRRKDSLPEWTYYYFSSQEEEEITFDKLNQNIKEAIDSGFDGNWPEFKKAIPNYLSDHEHFKFKSATRYVLWQYENSLREEAKDLSKLGLKRYKSYNTIEHIKPQNSGLSYIHKLGNLALLTQSDNSKASDNEFTEKKEGVYSKYYDRKNSDKLKLLQYRDIISKNDWGEQQVTERFRKIKTFVLEYFCANNL
jgi:hypothetical protein